jgi:branched-chain amino acid transport system ATP-binding protein
MLELVEVHSFYGKSKILHGVSLHIDKGELVTLLGRNGVGKSTTLKSIMGIVTVRSGNILFKDQNLLGKKPYDIFRQGVGYVPQGRKIFTSLTVLENLNIAQGATRGSKAKTLEWILSVFPRLKQRIHHGGSELSGGEQQMLAIARVLVEQPEVILLDEPSEGLAPLMVSSISQVLSELKDSGMTALLVEANLNMAVSLGTRHYVMDQGTIVYEPTTKQLGEDEELLNKYFRI